MILTRIEAGVEVSKFWIPNLPVGVQMISLAKLGSLQMLVGVYNSH